jgi:hypothetical protein
MEKEELEIKVNALNNRVLELEVRICDLTNQMSILGDHIIANIINQLNNK